MNGIWDIHKNFIIEKSDRVLSSFTLWDFSTVVKDAKQHQWRHMQAEINSLHKLDKIIMVSLALC